MDFGSQPIAEMRDDAEPVEAQEDNLSESSSLNGEEMLEAQENAIAEVFREEVEKFRCTLVGFEENLKRDLSVLRTDLFDRVDRHVQSKWEELERHLTVAVRGNAPQERISSSPHLTAPQISQPHLSPHPSEDIVSTGDASQPRPPIAAPKQPVLSLAELPPVIAALMDCFFPKRHSGQERLSALQNSFFLWKMEELAITDTKNLMVKAAAIEQHGLELRLWLPGWAPRGAATLTEFLAEKIKTVLKKKRRTSLLEAELKSKLQKTLHTD
ncbi:uncharacterized protein LOC118493007 [Sander lucioperca]|uniref:uncharacterized protein LOC118493007 n=1 Tax=Sander lucioperca TaxID=283035 RepID=UPI0016539053|nr:uncharacterized protein LOC118493007 [Sander lucioperca]